MCHSTFAESLTGEGPRSTGTPGASSAASHAAGAGAPPPFQPAVKGLGLLHRAVDESVRRQLEPIWHSVGWRTRQIVKVRMHTRLSVWGCECWKSVLCKIRLLHRALDESVRRQLESIWHSVGWRTHQIVKVKIRAHLSVCGCAYWKSVLCKITLLHRAVDESVR